MASTEHPLISSPARWHSLALLALARRAPRAMTSLVGSQSVGQAGVHMAREEGNQFVHLGHEIRGHPHPLQKELE